VLQCHRHTEQRFVLAGPKELGKNKIYKIEATDTNLVLAKDSGVVEIRSLENSKVVQ